jgi:hypothetical protein
LSSIKDEKEMAMNTGDQYMKTKRITVSLLISLVMSLLAVAAGASQTLAAEPSRPWTTVGSVGTTGNLTTTCLTGTLTQPPIQFGQCSPPADLPILEVVGGKVALPVIPADNPLIATRPPTLYKETAVIRYNVVAVEGLFQSGDSVSMKVRFLDTGDNSQLLVKLIELNLQSGVATTRLAFDSDQYAGSSSYQQQEALTSSLSEFDYTKNAYYIHATLTRVFLRITGSPFARSLTDIVGPGLESIQLERISP